MYIKFLIFLIIIATIDVVKSLTLSDSSLRVKYGDEALNALDRLLKFFESDANDLNLDGVYGLRIAQGQLNALHEILTSKSNENHRLINNKNYVASLSKQIERIVKKSLTILAKDVSAYLHRFLLIASKPFQVDFEPRSIKKSLLEHGSKSSEFDEDESDACFAELLGSTDRPNATKCAVTDPCWAMMTTEMTTGYRLTHQLLWFLVAKNIGCLDNRSVSNAANKNFKYIEDRYCTNIYDDAKLNRENNDGQDLFLEELVLCSMIGYEDFLRIDWFNMVLSWQNQESGCFDEQSERNPPSNKMKRHLLVEQEMNQGCLSHKSGLAAGLLATYARAFLQ